LTGFRNRVVTQTGTVNPDYTPATRLVLGDAFAGGAEGRWLITFEGVTKRYPDGTVAVDDLDLEVPDGKTMVLVGPSGCGKTTTLRMINRLVEASEGRILLNGDDIRAQNPAKLRRGIGYVIQQTGLFPHRTIEDNIATVPVLNGWRRAKARARARELLTTVGLDPALAKRYPHQLSGGQQQRVGVARALAADPPVLLMDEPFSAVDPVVRGQLQEQLIALHHPHGTLAQLATPERLLAAPADDYVAGFVGFDRGIRRLSFFRTDGLSLSAGPVLPETATVAAAVKTGEPWILVVASESDPTPSGWLPSDRLAGLDGAALLKDVAADPFGHTFTVGDDSLRAALDAAVLSPAGLAIGVDADGRVAGLATFDQLRSAVQAAQAAQDALDAQENQDALAAQPGSGPGAAP